MTAQLARLVSHLKGIALPLAVGLLLVTGLVTLGAVFTGGSAEGAAISTTSQSFLPAVSQAVSMPAAAAAAAPAAQASNPDHVIVGLDAGAALPDLSGYGLTDARLVGHGGMDVLTLAADKTSSVAEVLQQVQSVNGVAWAEEETPVSACFIPNDPYYPPSGLFALGQWGLPRMGMPAACNDRIPSMRWVTYGALQS